MTFIENDDGPLHVDDVDRAVLLKEAGFRGLLEYVARSPGRLGGEQQGHRPWGTWPKKQGVIVVHTHIYVCIHMYLLMHVYNVHIYKQYTYK